MQSHRYLRARVGAATGVAGIATAVAVVAALAVQPGHQQRPDDTPLVTEYRKDLLVRQLLEVVEGESESLRKLVGAEPGNGTASIRAEIAALRAAGTDLTTELMRLAGKGTESRLTGAVETALADMHSVDDRVVALAVARDAVSCRQLMAESELRLQAFRAAAGMLTAWRVERIVDARSNSSRRTPTSLWLPLAMSAALPW